MRESMKKVQQLIKAKAECIWITTYEENEVIRDLIEITRSNKQGSQLKIWSHSQGLGVQPLTKHEAQQPYDNRFCQPSLLFNEIRESQSKPKEEPQVTYVLRDLHHLLGQSVVNRGLRDLKEYPSSNHTPIIVISPVVDIPTELEKLFTIVDYELPTKEHIMSLARSFVRKMQEKGSMPTPTEEELQLIVKSCSGLTIRETTDVFLRSIVQHGRIDPSAALEQKIQLVKKSGVLDYSMPHVNLDDIGGNMIYKQWIEEVKDSFSEEAAEFGVKLPKGALHVGVAGTSKSLMAEALASNMSVPLIKFQMSKIMDRLVGSSEKKMANAMRVVKAISPCVLLIDEIEKSLGGISSSSQTDGGTLARVFDQLLQFLNDNDSGVFVVMTSNDVSALPPELTRAGRLDAKWFFTLPTLEERKEIFKIHARKAGRELTDVLIDTVSKEAENYTGAEIEEVIKVSMRKAYRRFKQDGNPDLLESDIIESINEVIPLYKSSRERILALNTWANGRARFTNTETIPTNDFSKNLDTYFEDSLSALLDE